MDFNKYKFETLALHAGQVPDPATLSRGVPIHRTSSYVFKNTEHAANLFALKELGNIYTRLMNPTHDVLEQRVAQLEGGAAAVALASGTAAIHNTVITIAKAGDEIVSASNLYGGTYTMFDAILPQFGITTRFVDNKDPASFEKAITEKTKLIFIETIGNPVLDFTDIRAIAQVAKKHHLPLVVDATFTTPYLLRVIEHGADIVINSLTKWMGGHGVAIGGIVVDSGKFDWKDPKFSLFNEPDQNYHGLKWAHDLPAPLAPIAFALRLRTVPLRNLGACISPDNAWIFLQGIETLPLRMQRHCDNALAAACFLKAHKQVAWVRYPGLTDDPSYAVASKYLSKGFGGMVVFGLKGGYQAAVKVIDNITLFSHLANVGDAKSLILHPASTSHSQLSEEQRAASGLSEDLIRLSIGLEHIDDITGALEAALANV
ncbi:MAG: O-acetylhomoserine aminocarboxypropyltransferase [Candidatus Raymondbacteria bacterium RifOxyC12_full_50_8]|uniref:O-acetylhomoserine aminocarboxypropyltransferase n=1 Tax=Candidatus Raymondbacteria bacterium RIFOXYD12_FULL_49_13 TaxID=1817890 RepID=A0A1F7FL80_UNCRA|nr:MAG: O-acetylhomoserine aminocarboxypropyltransferase [Candidatus Raymondbacteria bacterium RIFOXYA2_FULL_49_16]OGK07484.1 MAG: O-acetylhomoserine aminocarboxypropyltransferase [Candidatus Raymondbacteria bacterium RIFOXYD12_FULL_49_13]OGK07770.1 MAG: O-acetylhomoserine aminocarboxypropyltransferase [Candidatus Raymondbacteria bacterium RifOxyC12_full_50_8]OGP43840.1 MAG: O-acetylhomoserine aminocarboxypropyltransferase [Candidatus Raymondbacteria bacterium RIFOXYB2_FULL_49_35]